MALRCHTAVTGSTHNRHCHKIRVMNALVLNAFGPADEVLSLQSIPPVDPAPGHVVVNISAAPINPADLNIIEGKYGELPELPAVIGNEGAGHISAVGEAVEGLSVGDLVVILRRGTWAGSVTVPATDVVKLPADTDPIQASMLAVNPPTALLMLEQFVDLQPGDWVVQNAANSAVGRCVIQIARARGIRTLNVVRRPGLKAELTSLGADVVVTEEVDLRKEMKALCGEKAALALNAVGGPSALNLANALHPAGCHVTYGAMGRQPVKIPNGLLIFSGIRFCGFWLTRWKSKADASGVSRVFGELSSLVRAGQLRIAVDSVFPPEQFLAAIQKATTSGRNGKVLLRFS